MTNIDIITVVGIGEGLAALGAIGIAYLYRCQVRSWRRLAAKMRALYNDERISAARGWAAFRDAEQDHSLTRVRLNKTLTLAAELTADKVEQANKRSRAGSIARQAQLSAAKALRDRTTAKLRGVA